MNILVTGANGFVGRYLLRELQENGHDFCALVCGAEGEDMPGSSRTIEIDITDAGAVSETIGSLDFDACIHLAGIAFVPAASENPLGVYEVNTMGVSVILEAIRKTSHNARVLVVTTSHVYGAAEEGATVDENHPLFPGNCYAGSKAAADILALTYSRAYGMHTMTARPSNHIGPGQDASFVAPAFARQVKDIATGKAEESMSVGNLDDVRDLSDVRDVVRAYRLLIENGRAGEAYNIASGKQTRIRAILDTLFTIADVSPEVTVAPEKYRPTTVIPAPDTSKLLKDTGWHPEIDLETSLRDIYEAI